MSLLFIAILFVYCKESEQDRIARLVNVWIGKTIQFPSQMCLTSFVNDTVITQCTRKQSSYTILSYVDTIGCTSCRLQLPKWKEMVGYLDSIYPNRVNFLMVFYPKERTKLIKYLRNERFDRFVYIDEMDSLNLMNKFLHEEHFCTFLLNKDDKIVVIGNPVLNSKVKEIYLNVISGEVMPSSNINQPLTIASLSKDSVDIGNFSWREEQTVEIVVSNCGKVPLVINDVITSCGCTTVEYSKQPVLKGKDLTLRIKYKAEHPEHFDKTIIVHCNAEKAPFRLKISGNAK